MTVSHILGLKPPWRRPIFTSGEPVCCLFASMIAHLWSVRVFPFSRPLRAQSPTTAGDHRAPHCYLVPDTISTAADVHCSLPCPTRVKAVCLHFTLSSLREFPALLSPTSLTTSSGFHVTPFTSPPLIVMYKISCKTAILQSIFFILWNFASQWLLSVWLKLIKIKRERSNKSFLSVPTLKRTIFQCYQKQNKGKVWNLRAVGDKKLDVQGKSHGLCGKQLPRWPSMIPASWYSDLRTVLPPLCEDWCMWPIHIVQVMGCESQC